MYGKSGFKEKLKIQNFVNSAGIVCIIYVRNIWIRREIKYLEIYKFNGKLCTLNVRNVWFCGEIENSKFRKFSGNCVHYMYGMSCFTEKLKIQNFVNPAGIVYIIYVQNIWICREIEYLEIYKFNGKLCTLYVRNVWICR